MAARAIWKGVLRLGSEKVPVKLYSAVQDRDVHFRLLHSKDKSPIKQKMINPETNESVPYSETKRAFETQEKDLVLLSKAELESLLPDKSRDIDIVCFVPPRQIDHRWYDRPYYLGPDGEEQSYFALIEALEKSGQEGLVRWEMRNKEYIGALNLHRGYPMLISLRHEQEVIPLTALTAPSGKTLDKKELAMARQLIGMLDAEFEPGAYHDEYREQVMKMIERKRQGKKLKTAPKPKKKPDSDLAAALASSVKREQKRA